MRSALQSLAILILTGIFASSTTAAERPNVLFLFADDQAFDTLAALGNEEIETPNLDRLVAKGTTFTRTYNMGSWSGAVCVASRTMLNTGRFLWKAEKVYKKTDAEREAGRFWSVLMGEAGYDTYFTGKWHVRTDAAKAFDTAGHIRGGMPNQTPKGYNRPIEGKTDEWKPWDTQFDGFWKGGKHWSEVVADDAEGFLRQSKQSDNPFFMYIAFNAPHDPRQSPQEYVEKYPLEDIAVPESYVPEYPYKEAMGAGKGLRDEKLAPFPRTEYAVKVHRQEYYAIITHMDEQIGRILDTLEATGQDKNTMIFFTADHGLAVGRHGLMGKQNLFDHSIRVPMIVVGPGVPIGKKLDAQVYLQDVMPTALELAGVQKPDYVQFRSLLPLITGERDQQYDAIYCAYLQLQRAVIEDDFKLILYPKISRALLYNLQDDPLELENLADMPSSQSKMRSLFATLLELQRETGDTLDLKSSFPTLASGATNTK
ncbi:sulfatase-like hydrolase/transferase [Thalassoroseus pseudoceratinae]|uniref:sulfatase-like hydrolase/transferase n=1 Tax=Thalassoroseus pseudoceratinae TaxID=2713176 RepID=UPI001421906E|nr:sulfatase-like hydrolase/transferase [Thalassoroseus pseudoceratinae]